MSAARQAILNVVECFFRNVGPYTRQAGAKTLRPRGSTRRRRELRRTIDAIDRQIDLLVYEMIEISDIAEG